MCALGQGIEVDPDPIPGGSEVEVKWNGEGPLYYRVPFGGGWKQVPIPNGAKRGKVRVPAGAGLLLFSNLAEPYEEDAFSVVDLGK